MIEDEIRQVVTDHYRGDGADVLLLSALGFKLRKGEKWPAPNEKRTLLEIVEGIPGIAVVRDDAAESFIAVVLEGEEKRAVSKIADRHKRYFLYALPKPLLLAFTLPMAQGHVMTIRLGQKLIYQGGPAAEEGTILVDEDLRLPGADIGHLKRWSSEEIERLETNIRTWAERHGVDVNDLSRSSRSEKQADIPKNLGSGLHGSALDRLYSAQDPEVARRLIMPIDIALTLSRLP